MHCTAEQLHAVLHLPHAHHLHGLRLCSPGNRVTVQHLHGWYHAEVRSLFCVFYIHVTQQQTTPPRFTPGVWIVVCRRFVACGIVCIHHYTYSRCRVTTLSSQGHPRTSMLYPAARSGQYYYGMEILNRFDCCFVRLCFVFLCGFSSCTLLGQNEFALPVKSSLSEQCPSQSPVHPDMHPPCPSCCHQLCSSMHMCHRPTLCHEIHTFRGERGGGLALEQDSTHPS